MKLPEITDRNLRKRAFTHRSYTNEHPYCPDNERLEFLGDAILGFIVSDILYQYRSTDRYMNEGEMTRLRSKLVNETQLAAFARQFRLGDRLYLGHSAKKDGGRHKKTILCDVFEAYIGALYLDSGLETVRRFIKPLIQEIINDDDGIAVQVVDEKNQLQQLTLEHFGTTPTYRIVNESGPDHARRFTALACVKGKVYGRGTGRKKQDAEKAAARNAYEKLSADP